jgi:hypothetical protein
LPFFTEFYLNDERIFTYARGESALLREGKDLTMKKKIIISVAVCCAVLIGLGVFFGVRAYLKNKVSFTVEDTLPDGGGKKVTVILLGGQSNASGCSLDEYLQKNVSAEKYAEYENGYDNVYINYFASGTNESKGFVKCSVRQGELGTCFGPELGLADKLHEMYPDEMFFIIKYAWGGTNLFEQWLSPSSKGKTGEMYRAFVTFVQTSIEYLESKNYDVTIEGMCWMQGESDSFSVENATDYEVHLMNLIKDIRKKFSRYAADDGIAFVDAYIASNPVYWVYCSAVNQSKKSVADSSPMNVVINTVSAGLSCSMEPEGNPDIPHYDSLSEIKLGHLFAEEVAEFFD